MRERLSEIKSSFDRILSIFEEEIGELHREVADLKSEVETLRMELKHIQEESCTVPEREPDSQEAQPDPEPELLRTVGTGPVEEEKEEEEEEEAADFVIESGDEQAEVETVSEEPLFEIIEDDRQPVLGETFQTPEPVGNKVRGKELSWMTDLPGEAIGDISEAIPLNDRFFFIRELFDGDEEQFDLTIERLNDARSFNQALSECRLAFPEWDEASDAVYRFYMIVRRKFL